MNTKQAVARYGMWATIAGYAAHYSRVGDVTRSEAFSICAQWTDLRASGKLYDTTYPDEALRKIQFSAKLRQL